MFVPCLARECTCPEVAPCKFQCTAEYSDTKTVFAVNLGVTTTPEVVTKTDIKTRLTGCITNLLDVYTNTVKDTSVFRVAQQQAIDTVVQVLEASDDNTSLFSVDVTAATTACDVLTPATCPTPPPPEGQDSGASATAISGVAAAAAMAAMAAEL